MKRIYSFVFNNPGLDQEQQNKVKELAYYIAVYNGDKQDQDFVNYLYNSIPYCFKFMPLRQGVFSVMIKIAGAQVSSIGEIISHENNN